MSKYWQPTYEFLSFNNPMTMEQIAEELTSKRKKDITFKVVAFSHRNNGMTVLAVRDKIQDIIYPNKTNIEEDK